MAKLKKQTNRKGKSGVKERVKDLTVRGEKARKVKGGARVWSDRRLKRNIRPL